MLKQEGEDDSTQLNYLGHILARYLEHFTRKELFFANHAPSVLSTKEIFKLIRKEFYPLLMCMKEVGLIIKVLLK